MYNTSANSGDIASAIAAINGVTLFIYFAILVVVLVAQWKLFSKAGEAGWKCLIPFYNYYIFYKILYGNGWKFLFLFVPVMNVIVSIAAYIRTAQVYGKGIGFGILHLFFSPITMCILAFGSAEYEGPVDSFI
ncbi:MAG: DUF5684 domain-containing protein [Oscillospiraceae bacterium]|nr:DUF5684 domain-containing protein [Oscillospiraceae bacterium]